MTVKLTFQNFHVYLAEDDVLAIEEGCRHGADEELLYVCLFMHVFVYMIYIYACVCMYIYVCIYIYCIHMFV